MSEALEELFLFGEEKMEKALAQLAREFGSVRSGRANPAILDKVLVDYYGAPTPLRQMSQVSVQDGTTLVISPYDKSILKEIEKAIIKALKLARREDTVIITGKGRENTFTINNNTYMYSDFDVVNNYLEKDKKTV